MQCISVVIPTLNEEGWIERTLESVLAQAGSKEIIVVDGGSTDLTRQRAAGYGKILQAPTGRARQMNVGAEHARGNVLLFLHGDTLLPEEAFPTIRKSLSAADVRAGTFRLSFDDTSPLLDFYSYCTQFEYPSLCFGDRGLFVRRTAFEEIGGYPEIPIFEDLELVRRLYSPESFVFTRPEVTTAARRFQRHGYFLQQLRNSCLWIFYMSGGDPHRIAHLYEYRKEK